MTRCSTCVACETCKTCFCKTSVGHPLRFCNCGWEARFRYCFAVSLPFLEAKRFSLMVLDMFIEGNAIRFGGGLNPAILSILDAGLGFPVALIDVYAIRKGQFSTYIKGAKRVCHFAVLITAICLFMNVATLISIAYHVNVEKPTLEKSFKQSMRMYPTKTSYKIAIDQIQIDLRCCGYSAYSDWFSYDWQSVNYATWEDMDKYSRIAETKFSKRSVPFSCCDIFAKSACIHLEIPVDDDSTLNTGGCTPILSVILRRFVILGYTMTSIFVLVQSFVIVFLVRIIRRSLNDGREYNSPCASKTCLTSMDSKRCRGPLTVRKSSKKTRSPRQVRVCSKPPRRSRLEKYKENQLRCSSSSSNETHTKYPAKSGEEEQKSSENINHIKTSPPDKNVTDDNT